MTRRMRKLHMVWREVKAGLKLSPLVLAALLFAAILWRTDSAANSGLFQSVPSPIDTPTGMPASPTPSATPPLLPTVPTLFPATPTLFPTAPTIFTPQPTATLPIEIPTLFPTETVEPTPTEAPTELPLTATPTLSPTIETGEAEATPDERGRYAEDSNLRFDLGMLFDSLALLLARGWLCCGVFIFLAIPILFVVLWVASKRRHQQEG